MAIYEKTGLTNIPSLRNEPLDVTISDGDRHVSLKIGSFDTAMLTADQARYLAGKLSAAASRLDKRTANNVLVAP